jgi:hypothetical protein
VDVIDVWTGHHANALRRALRLTNEAFAHALGTAVRTVAKWSAEPDIVPVPELQHALDTMLQRAPDDARNRFQLLANSAGDRYADWSGADSGDTASILRLDHDPAVGQILSWIDDRSGWSAGEARRRTSHQLRVIDRRSMLDRSDRRDRVDRASLTDALLAYYNTQATYQARCSEELITTSILTKPGWIDLRMPLVPGRDHIQLDPTSKVSHAHQLDGDAAVQRLAEVLLTDTRFVNAALYRLLQMEIQPGRIDATVGLMDFAAYALSLDLLENELTDRIATGLSPAPGALPLRDAYLPTISSVTAVGNRLCAGGPLALFAAARQRPAGDDYVLLVQERAGSVLNAGHRLAVIPKAFHQPLSDFSDDARISATLQRELEEELFGRVDVDSTRGGSRQADPLHLSRLSAPMRWLIENSDPGRWRMECTGFGLNLVSGNFEFACLVLIEDKEWWRQFGGHIEANWETDRLRCYSSRDRDVIEDLVHDASWTNEGLFAFLQGLRRLEEIDPDRVDLPPIMQEA